MTANVAYKKALVTGATGYVGSQLVVGLLSDGWEVHIIVRESSNLDQLSDIKDDVITHIYNGGFEQLSIIMSRILPDVVFHLASMIVAEHNSEKIDELISSNITFGSLLLESMSVNGVKNFINTGTYWEHYEAKTYSPVNLYAATKYAFQALLQYFVEAKKINSITLKLFDLYGVNDPRPKLLNYLLEIAKSEDILKMSPGEQQIDLVNIGDVIRAYIIAANRLMSGKVKSFEIYGVASGMPMSLKKLVAQVEIIINSKINVEWGGRPYKNREVMNLYQTLSNLPDWEAKISLKQGIDEILVQTGQNDKKHIS